MFFDFRTVLLKAALMGVALTSCTIEHPCDDGQDYVQGTCVAAMVSNDAAAPEAGAGDAGSSDAGEAGSSDAGEAADSGCAEVVEDQIGHECTGVDECGCAAPFCAIQPGASSGYCTISGCDPDDENGCPSSYRCFDLSSVGASGIEPFCIHDD